MTTPTEWMKDEYNDLVSKGFDWKPPVITGASSARCIIDGSEKIMLCANNYLNLSTHPKVRQAAIDAVKTHGAGSGSVRPIAGNMDIHNQLEETIARFKNREAALYYQTGFAVNSGLIPQLAGKNDAIISDQLNHASIIDGIRLCKAQRYRYANSDMADLEAKLKEAQGARLRLIATDGVFSMDGFIAKLDEITALAKKYDAMVMVDDSHATGFVGKTGRGSAEHCGVMDKVDVWTSTLGKALGGASGGFTTGRKEIIDLLRQRSRPYLFSNTVAPAIVAASIKVFEMLSATTELRDKLEANTEYFRNKMTAAGFDIKPGIHPIVPIMLYDAVLAQNMAAALLDEGIYVIGFFFPVVPKGEARIRVQISAGMETDHLDRAIHAFTKVGKKLNVI